MSFFSKFSWRNFDWGLMGAVFFLILIGLAAIYSVDLSRGSELVYFRKQSIALLIGTILLFWAAGRQSGFFRSYAKWSYFLCILALIAVLFFGTTIRGTRGWFSVFGFSFQPVELAKWGLILALAYIVSRFGRKFERPLFFFGTGIITLILMGLVLLQPDLGSAVILGLIWFGIMCLVGTRKIYLIGLVVIVVVTAIFSWFFLLQDYQKNRVLTFVNPAADPLGAGYNTNQAAIAIGSGKFFGRGLGFGSQSQLRFLPEAQTDFVFSVIGEELGFAGAIAVLGLYGFIFWRMIRIIKHSDNDFAAVIVGGVTIVFFSQLIINVGANLGILPVTGVTLPFVSYGGSSLMINLLMIGMVQSVIEKRY